MTTGADRSRAYRERKRAAGWRLTRGRWTREPRREPIHPDTEHGVRGYWRGCRCTTCRAGWAAYMRAREAGS